MKPTRSANRIETRRRSATGPTGAAPLVEGAGVLAVEPLDVGSIALPHSAQNLAPGSGTAPQLRQVAWKAWPHSGQKRAVAGAADPQLEHVIPSMPSIAPLGGQG